MEGHNLTGWGVHGHPEPWRVGSLPDAAPHLVGCSFSLLHDARGWPCRSPYMEVSGTRRKAFHQKVQQPRATDTYRTPDPAQRDARAPPVRNQRARRISNDVVFRAGHTRAATHVALMLRFAGARMAIFLNWLRVLGTAEFSQVDQRIRQQLHPNVSLLNTLKPQKPPFERIFPGKGPVNSCPQGMHRGME